MIYLKGFLFSWFLVGVLTMVMLFCQAYRLKNLNLVTIILTPFFALGGWLVYFAALVVLLEQRKYDKLMEVE